MRWSSRGTDRLRPSAPQLMKERKKNPRYSYLCRDTGLTDWSMMRIKATGWHQLSFLWERRLKRYWSTAWVICEIWTIWSYPKAKSWCAIQNSHHCAIIISMERTKSARTPSRWNESWMRAMFDYNEVNLRVDLDSKQMASVLPWQQGVMHTNWDSSGYFADETGIATGVRLEDIFWEMNSQKGPRNNENHEKFILSYRKILLRNFESKWYSLWISDHWEFLETHSKATKKFPKSNMILVFHNTMVNLMSKYTQSFTIPND